MYVPGAPSLLDAPAVDAYLDRIGADRDASLAELQERHLLSVPFENLGIHLGEPIVLDPPALFDKIVTRRRGGFCYELNGSFAALLSSLGHRCAFLGAKVIGAGDRLGPPFDHMALLVDDHADAVRKLVDVGFGRFATHPLRWEERGDQQDAAGTFCLLDVDGPDGDVDVSMDGRRQYRLERRERELAEFGPTCWWQQTSPDSHFTGSLICSRLTPTGRVSISGDLLIRTDNGNRHEHTLAGDDEILAAYRNEFGIQPATVPRVAAGR